MIRDILTVMWKEFREIPAMHGGGRKGWLFPVIFLGIFSIYFPLSFGRMFVEQPFALAFAPMMSLSWVLGIIPDAIAGERERHTLETLLASPLSDRGILLGKVAAAVCASLVLSFLVLCLALVTVNVANWGHGLMFYDPRVFFGALGASFLTSISAAAVGVLVSVRAATVKQAGMTLVIAMWGFMGLGFVAVRVIMKLGPSRQKMIEDAFTRFGRFGLAKIILIAVAFLVLVAVVLLLAAIKRFRRTRLILD